METKIEFSADTVSMSFEQIPDGDYHIQTHDRFGQMTGDYHVAAENLRQNLPGSLVDYIKSECELNPGIWHSVPLQRVFDIPLEFKENQRKRRIQRYHNEPTKIDREPMSDELIGAMVRAASKEGAVIDEEGRVVDVASADNPSKFKDSIAEYKERLEKRPLNLGVHFIEFRREDNGTYTIKTNIWLQCSNYKEYELMDEYHVAEKNLDAVLPPAVAEYVRQASGLNVPIGEYDSYRLKTEAWRYGWHAVPILHKLNVPQEYAQELIHKLNVPQEYTRELNRIAISNEDIVPNRINNTEITSEQKDLLRLGELVVVKNVSKGDEKKTLAVLLDKNHGFQKMEVPFFMANAPLSEIKELWNENARFNEQLNQQAEGKLEQGHVYDLGYPKAVLLSTGIPELPIHLSAKTLNIKSHDKLHGYELLEIRGLVSSLQQPWAIFKYGDADKAQNMIVGLSFEEKHFLVGMSLRPTVNGQVLEINSVRNVFPKDNHEWINWITQGKLLRVDEPKKIQDIIDKLRINPVAFGYVDLDSATKILKEFKNPKLPVKIPSKINGIALSAKQKEELRNGNRIKVPAAGNPGKTVSVKLSEDGRPVVVPFAKPAIKQEPGQHSHRNIR